MASWRPRFEPDLPGVIAVSLAEGDYRVEELHAQLGYLPAAVRPTPWAYTELPPEGRALPAVGAEVAVEAEPFTIVRLDARAYAIVPYRGASLPPGPVWILSPRIGWQPRGVALEQVDERTWRAGPLELATVLRDDQRGELAIVADGARLGAHAFHGTCAPLAVWLIEPEGPAIVVLHDHQFAVYLVGAGSIALHQRISF